MKQTLLSLLAVAATLASCEKEIDIDYQSAAPLYVAEGILTQDRIAVTLTTTQLMEENTRTGHYVADATVVVSCKKEGSSDTLRYTHNGIYRSAYRGIAGQSYDLDIYVAGQHFHSTSTMQEAAVLKSMKFVWQDMVGQRLLFAKLLLDDTPGQNSYYFMHLYRNGVGYRWAVMSDEHNHNGELQQLFSCCSERDMDKGDEDALRDGDQMLMEIRAIDRRTYDYFYSLQTMDNAGSNPIAHFTGGCLGYFSAGHVQSHNMVFRRSEVEEE